MSEEHRRAGGVSPRLSTERPGQPGAQRRACARRSPFAAFTLVELLVVICIITVMSAMVIPRLGGALGRSKLRSATQALVLAARFAQDYAVSHRCACRLVFDESQRRYGLEYQPDPETMPSMFVVKKDGIGKAAILPDGVEFGRVRIDTSTRRDPADDRITFDPTGGADPAVVELTDGRRTVSVVVIGSSGRVLVVNGPVSDLPNDRTDLDA